MAQRVVAFLAVIAAACVAASWPATAAAELIDDADRLIEIYREREAEAWRAATLFLTEGEARRVGLEPAPGRCVTVVAMGTRRTEMVLRGPGRRPAESSAGIVEVTDCSGELKFVDLTLRSERGAVEVIVAAHDEPLPAVADVLLHRALGPTAPDGDTVGALPLAPIEERAARADEVARADGARMVVAVNTVADDRGVGAVVLQLGAGCHRVMVLATGGATASGSGVDVDAEVRHRGEQTPIVLDRSHAPDARLDFCIGESEGIELRYLGAGASADITIQVAFWPLPPGLPEGWGAKLAGGLAWALHRRRLPALVDPPEQLFLGEAGATAIPLTVEKGSCYVAALGFVRGEPVAARLSATGSQRMVHDDGSQEPHTAAVSFCADADEVMEMGVEVRARSAWWLMSLWRVTPLEAP